MAATKRSYYEPSLKIAVLDEVKAAGEVSSVARKRQLEPSLVYSWKAHEEEIRANFERNGAAGAAGIAKKPAALKLVPPRTEPKGAEEATKPKKAGKEAAHPDGPKMVVRGMGGWLRKALREELDRELPQAVIDAIVTELDRRVDARVDALVEAKLEQMFSRMKGKSSG